MCVVQMRDPQFGDFVNQKTLKKRMCFFYVFNFVLCVLFHTGLDVHKRVEDMVTRMVEATEPKAGMYMTCLCPFYDIFMCDIDDFLADLSEDYAEHLHVDRFRMMFYFFDGIYDLVLVFYCHFYICVLYHFCRGRCDYKPVLGLLLFQGNRYLEGYDASFVISLMNTYICV